VGAAISSRPQCPGGWNAAAGYTKSERIWLAVGTHRRDVPGFLSGAQWQVGIVVKDLVADSAIPFSLTPTTAVSGHLGTSPWTAQSERFHYTIPAANLGPHKG
jgi:hypothetical protein